METKVQELRDRARRLRRNQTDVEAKLWSHLRARKIAGAKFRRQYPIGHLSSTFAVLSNAWWLSSMVDSTRRQARSIGGELISWLLRVIECYGSGTMK